MRKMFLVVFVLAILIAMGGAVMAQPTADVSPVLLQPFDVHGTVGQVLKGLTLSLHPNITTSNKNLQWLAQHGTLEIPCVGESWEELRAGFGAALNFGTQEGISLKAGIAYISEVRKPAVMVGIKFPLG